MSILQRSIKVRKWRIVHLMKIAVFENFSIDSMKEGANLYHKLLFMYSVPIKKSCSSICANTRVVCMRLEIKEQYYAITMPLIESYPYRHIR